jgi:oligopeptide transport system permease protein
MATQPIAIAAAAPPLVRARAGLWSDAWRRLRRNRLALVAGGYLIFLVAVAVLASFWTPYSISHEAVATPYQGPSAAHPLGADAAGRDILSRLMLGAQISLIVGLSTQVIVVVVGVSLGLLAGYFRGWLDSALSLLINIFYGVPDILVALILIVILGHPGLDKIIIAIAVTRWMDMARLVRGQALSLREREFVEAARSSGSRPAKIIFRHLLPNSLGPIIVQGTLGIPTAILFEAFLSFLGLGVPPPTPSWGSMAADGIQAIRISPHIVLAPSIALCLTLMAFNFLGDGIRDALDPRQRR